jgi:hypothetical protein
MELGIPLLALGSLYVINNQSKKPVTNSNESFQNKNGLPNTNIPNRNYPDEFPIVSTETDQTSKLSHDNKFDSPYVYTDKYFNPRVNPDIVNTQIPMNGQTAKSSDAAASTYYSLTGQQVDSGYFQHNNMVPFFGSNLRSRQVDANSNESVLDNMNGSGSQNYNKKEQSPLFAPAENNQWANGAPINTDFYQSRVNVGSRMANVKPFAEEHVGPGLGLGYTSQGSGGFNSGMAMRDQWLDKDVDGLRVANKPKASGLGLYGHEGPAMSRVTHLGSIGQQEKNRPDTVFEMSEDRWFTTTGAEKAPMLHAIPIDRNVTRPETTTDYVGGAGLASATTYVPGQYMPSTNIELGAVPVAGANAGGRQYANDGDYGIKSKRAYPNNRSANQQDDYFGAVGGAFGAAVAPLLDILRPSRKENTIGTLRPYQNPRSEVAQSYIFNPADRPSTTIRETTENSKFHLNVNANQRGGAYDVTDHQAIENNRQNTSDFYYAGGAAAGSGTRETRAYNAEYNQRNNDVKSSTIQGRMVKGNMSLMNGDVNMQTNTNRDAYMKNNRSVAPTMPYQAPDVAAMGRVAGNGGSSLYSNIQLDRSNPEILSALSGNPYAINTAKRL